MIERLGNATVAYVTDDFIPTTPERATLVKVIYDNGRVTFARPTPGENALLAQSTQAKARVALASDVGTR